MITTMLNRFAGDSVMTDNIVKRLRELAPTIYSEDDAIASKANELVMVAKTVQGHYNQMTMLKESLQVLFICFSYVCDLHIYGWNWGRHVLCCMSSV